MEELAETYKIDMSKMSSNMKKFNTWVTQKELLSKNADLNDPEVQKNIIIGWCPEWRYIKDEETGEFILDPETGEKQWKYRLLPFERYSEKFTNPGTLLYTMRYEDRIEDFVGKIDGLLMPGGSDADPKYYGEENTDSKVEYEHSDIRWKSNQDIYENAPKDMPIMAICFGYQFFNIRNGGNLIQDLENKEEHLLKIRKLKVKEGTHLHKALGSTETICFCAHHQNIKKVADSLVVNCEDVGDGSVHGLELPMSSGRNFFSVLFHPEENLDELFGIKDWNCGNKIFTYLIKLAREYKEKRE